MPLDRHLVVHLQEMFSTEKDYRDYMMAKSSQVQDNQLKSVVSDEIKGIGTELNNLEQCLAFFNEFPKQDLHSPLVSAIQQEDAFTMQAMPSATKADMDMHLVINDITMGNWEIGIYQTLLDMAKALNQRDVINLLQENLSHEKEDLQKMQAILPNFIKQSQQKAA